MNTWHYECHDDQESDQEPEPNFVFEKPLPVKANRSPVLLILEQCEPDQAERYLVKGHIGEPEVPPVKAAGLREDWRNDPSHDARAIDDRIGR
jgi:hypothetical protein